MTVQAHIMYLLWVIKPLEIYSISYTIHITAPLHQKNMWVLTPLSFHIPALLTSLVYARPSMGWTYVVCEYPPAFLHPFPEERGSLIQLPWLYPFVHYQAIHFLGFFISPANWQPIYLTHPASAKFFQLVTYQPLAMPPWLIYTSAFSDSQSHQISPPMLI